VALLPAPVVVLLIGVARIELGAHTRPEVVIGAAVGCAGVLGVLVLGGPPPRRVWPPRWLGPALVTVVLLLHGYHLRAEQQIRQQSARFAWLTAVCADFRHLE
jgi:hypothetical protein